MNIKTPTKKMFSSDSSEKTGDICIGDVIFIRAITFHYVGRVTRVSENFVHLEEASWVADSGRFGEALSLGTLNDVEPMGKCMISLNAIVDVAEWRHPLPKEAK